MWSLGIIGFMQIGNVTFGEKTIVRKYELALVLRPDGSEADRDEFVEMVRKMIVDWGGEVERTHEEGKKQLAYEIEKLNEAFYYFIEFSLPTTKVNDLDLKLKYEEMVLRHLIIREDEK